MFGVKMSSKQEETLAILTDANSEVGEIWLLQVNDKEWQDWLLLCSLNPERVDWHGPWGLIRIPYTVMPVEESTTCIEVYHGNVTHDRFVGVIEEK